MFCRFCGTAMPGDAAFCQKCGRKQDPVVMDGPGNRLVRSLKTPYPYFGLLVVLFLVWVVAPRRSGADYSQIQWRLELDREVAFREDNLFRQSLWLILENKSTRLQQNIPIELRARIEPVQEAEVLAEFLGRKLVIYRGRSPLPLTVILGDAVQAGDKRRYFFGGSVQSKPPFKVTYEVRSEDDQSLLAVYTHEVR